MCVTAIEAPTCRYCGKETKVYLSSGRAKEFCGRLCKLKWQRRIAPRKQFRCEICGGSESRGGKCVNQSCKIALGYIKIIPTPCLGCGRVFKRLRSDRIGYCSSECFHANTPRRKEVGSHTKVRPCLGCGRFVRRERKRCAKCLALHRAEYLEKERQAARSQGWCKCQYCSKVWYAFTSAKKLKFCSTKCVRKSQGRNHRKRARKYGVAYEPINLGKLIQRDGGRCSICNDKVVRSSTFNTRWATIGHIIPISQGGPHKWSNVQLECWECNTKAGAKRHGQHRMF